MKYEFYDSRGHCIAGFSHMSLAVEFWTRNPTAKFYYKGRRYAR